MTVGIRRCSRWLGLCVGFWSGLSVLAVPAASASQVVDVVTAEHLLPFSFKDATGVQQGLMTAVVQALAERSGQPLRIRPMPWARAVEQSRLEKRVMIYPLIYLPERQDDYLWIGPVTEDRFAFVVRADQYQTWSSLEALKRARIGALRGAPSGKRIQTLGYAQVEYNNDHRALIGQLMRGHIDAWYSCRSMIEENMRERGIDPDQFVIIDEQTIRMYIGASQDLAQLASEWNRLLQEMRDDGSLRRVVDTSRKRP